jgi:hypothetical protein
MSIAARINTTPEVVLARAADYAHRAKMAIITRATSEVDAYPTGLYRNVRPRTWRETEEYNSLVQLALDAREVVRKSEAFQELIAVRLEQGVGEGIYDNRHELEQWVLRERLGPVPTLLKQQV